jgi:P-aminobenzoate N-oxygenase AurF
MSAGSGADPGHLIPHRPGQPARPAGVLSLTGGTGATAHAPACPQPYTSRFANWDSRASVRTRPVRRLGPAEGGRLYFPPELAPEVMHPKVTALGPAAAGLVLLHRLYGYLNFTSELEASTVIPVAATIARGRGGFGVPPEMRSDAFKIVTDEAWHAQFSDSLAGQLETRTGVPPMEHMPAFQSRLDRLLAEEVTPDLRRPAGVLIAICSETLISSLLATLPNDTRLPAAVSATVRDHAEDEGRHHAYFRSVLTRFWPELAPGEQRALGPLLPDVIRAFLEPDYAYIRQCLNAAGLNWGDTVHVVGECYPQAAQRDSCARAARSTTRYLIEAGALQDAHTRERFLASGLLGAGDSAS